MDAQRERARAASRSGGLASATDLDAITDFSGYQRVADEAASSRC